MKKVTRILALVLTVILAFAMLAACGKKKEEKKYEDAEYMGEPMELTFSFGSSEEYMKPYKDAEAAITKRTGGRVTFTNYFGGSLVSATEALDAIQSGMCDLADITLTNFPDRFPYSEQVCATPFVGFTSIPMAADVYRQYIPSHPECMAEFTACNITPLLFVGVWGTALTFRDVVEINGPDDLAGKKIITASAGETQFLQDCGAIPVSDNILNLGELFQNGVVDGSMVGLYLTNMFGALDFAKSVYYFDASFTTGCRAFCINNDVWNSFDPTLQKIFQEELSSDEFLAYAAETWAANDQSHLDKCDELGLPVNRINGDKLKVWQDKAAPYTEAKLAELESKGYTEARRLHQDLVDLITNYNGPFK